MSTLPASPPRRITQDWIARIAAGKSFVDIGGLWGTVNERVSDAARAGASQLTMADMQPAGNEWWQKFLARAAELSVGDVRCVTVDVMSPGGPDAIGRHDVVHCSGIIYHLPDPYQLLQQLRRVANEYVILVSMVVPERIETESGTLALDGGEALFVPGLDAYQLTVVREHYRKLKVNIGSFENFHAEKWVQDDGTPRFGPWWWLMTPAFLRRMLEVAGFEVIEDARVNGVLTHGYLCRVPQ